MKTQFKVGDKVKRIKSGEPTDWYMGIDDDLIGEVSRIKDSGYLLVTFTDADDPEYEFGFWDNQIARAD